MKQTVKDELLSLLRCELCGQEVPSASYTPEEFKVLIRMAREQAVSALVAECLMKHNVKVNDDGAMEIMAILVSHQRHAAQIDAHVATLATLAGIVIVLMMVVGLVGDLLAQVKAIFSLV